MQSLSIHDTFFPPYITISFYFKLFLLFFTFYHYLFRVYFCPQVNFTLVLTISILRIFMHYILCSFIYVVFRCHRIRTICTIYGRMFTRWHFQATILSGIFYGSITIDTFLSLSNLYNNKLLSLLLFSYLITDGTFHPPYVLQHSWDICFRETTTSSQRTVIHCDYEKEIQSEHRIFRLYSTHCLNTAIDEEET